jgi:hypothetical protein
MVPTVRVETNALLETNGNAGRAKARKHFIVRGFAEWNVFGGS